MAESIWAFLRIFEYLLVAIVCMALLRMNPNRYIYVGNILVSLFLMFNAINYVQGVPNTKTFQITFTFVVTLWAITHLAEFLRREK